VAVLCLTRPLLQSNPTNWYFELVQAADPSITGTGTSSISYNNRIVLLPQTAETPTTLTALNNQSLRGYFAYASDLNLSQMSEHCPSSSFVCVAALEGWKWVINSRGSATILKSPGDVVYGFVYLLTADDEAALDKRDGVFCQKRDFPVDIGAGIPGRSDGWSFKAFTFVDYVHWQGDMKAEYIKQLSSAISDAIAKGVPRWYVNRYIQQ
jgi:gamma-glutamylcyclotransferase